MGRPLTGTHTRYTQISTLQFVFLLMVLIFPTEMFTLPGPLALKAGIEAPWAVVLAGLESLLPLWIGLWASRSRTGSTVFTQLRVTHATAAAILGIAFLVVMWFYVVFAMGQFVDIVHGFLLVRTPPVVSMLFAAILVAYVTQGSIEPMARMAEFVVVVGLPLVLLVFILAMPYMDIHWVQPIWPYRPTVALKNSLLPASYLGETVMTAVLGAHLKPGTRPLRAGALATALNTAVLLVALYLPLLLFGPIHTSVLTAPLLTAVRDIHYGYILERLDTVVLPIWIVLICLKMSVGTFVAAEGFVNAFGHRRTRWLPSGIIGTGGIAALYLFQSLPSTEHAIGKYWLDYTFPALVLTIALAGALVRLGRRIPEGPFDPAGPRPTPP